MMNLATPIDGQVEPVDDGQVGTGEFPKLSLSLSQEGCEADDFPRLFCL